MGCATSRAAGAEDATFFDISKPGKDLGIKDNGWKTIRVYVSSTFEDFHPEREVLRKQVFPDLRAWCESRRLSLAECDLIWGVPKDSNNELAMRACLGEIDRCYQDNVMPFFLNMTSERIGWVPQENVPEAVKTAYEWIEGLSDTEMKLVKAAYRNDNPNALFMLRDPSFFTNVPEEEKKHFVDSQDIAPDKVDILNNMIREEFPNDRVKSYVVEYVGYNEESKMVELAGLEDTFYKEVTAFLQERIEQQYPQVEENLDPYQQTKHQHESFMKSRCATFFGRQRELYKIERYIISENDAPLLVVAGDGAGKSSLLAKVAGVATTRALEGFTPESSCSKRLPCHVFYHFAGAVPGSTELLGMLRRFLKEMGVVDESSMPKDLDEACQLTREALANTNTGPVIMIVDALNQFDESDKAAELVRWVPKKLAPHVRCVFSTTPGTKRHSNLEGHGPEPRILKLSSLNKKTRKAIVNESLGRYNKRLGEEQLRDLLNKKCSKNPLWLSMACEELRLLSHHKQVSDKIKQLAGTLPGLEIQLLDRLEKENGGELLKATLCLLEVSPRGLLEEELLVILADYNTKPCDAGEIRDEEDSMDSGEDEQQLPANKWASVYRALRPFLHPFGEGWEGRLVFYHRSLSTAVRKKYFGNTSEADEARLRWHRKLADFSKVSTNFTRKVEELPDHLLAIKDKARLEAFLVDWDVMEELFDMDYSYKLLTYWRLGSDFESLKDRYTTLVDEYTQRENVTEADKVDKCELVAKILAQACWFEEGTRLCNEAIEIEKEVGPRPHKMAMLYNLQGVLVDDAMKLDEYRNKGQLSRIKTAIDSYKKAEKEMDSMKDEDRNDKYKTTLGRIHNRLAFLYSGYSLRGGDRENLSEYLSEGKDVMDLADESVKKATTIFKELKDGRNIAESKVVEGLCFRQHNEEQIQCYKKAEELALRVSGPLNPIMDRLYLNMGIYYEETGDFKRAHECFYKRFITCRDFFGMTHPKITRTITTLQEGQYRQVARRRGVKVPQYPCASK